MTTNLGTRSLAHAIGILIPEDFKTIVDTKRYVNDAFKPCFLDVRFDGSKQMYLCMDFAAVQKTHFICAADNRVLEDDFVVFLEFDDRCSAEVSANRTQMIETDW